MAYVESTCGPLDNSRTRSKSVSNRENYSEAQASEISLDSLSFNESPKEFTLNHSRTFSNLGTVLYLNSSIF